MLKHTLHTLIIYSTFFSTGNALPSLRSRADGSGPFYGPKGLPEVVDIQQTINLDCGWASSIAAIAYIAPEWLKYNLEYIGPMEAATDVTVRMYNMTTKQPVEYKVKKEETIVASDIRDSTGIWWPGAYNRAAIGFGLDFDKTGHLNHVSPGDAMSGITGLKQSMTTKEKITTADDLWEILKQGVEKKTPIVIQSDATAGTMAANHAFALMSLKEDNGNQTVTVYNPWGQEETYTVGQVKNDLIYVWYLDKYPGWTGKGWEGGLSISPEGQTNLSTIVVSSFSSQQSTAALSSISASSSSAPVVAVQVPVITTSSSTISRIPLVSASSVSSVSSVSSLSMTSSVSEDIALPPSPPVNSPSPASASGSSSRSLNPIVAVVTGAATQPVSSTLTSTSISQKKTKTACKAKRTVRVR